jgi:dGTPase
MLARLRFPVERSRGRQYPEPEHPYRNAFQRDRDRIVHSRAFRRLEAKTQVFTPGLSDHFRNRLTHTIEVAQIARTVAGVLQLDDDLTEALALAHDSVSASTTTCMPCASWRASSSATPGSQGST